MNNLLIIGNGFDLAHNLKTSYKDFVKFVTDSLLKNENTFPKLLVPNIQSEINYDSLINQIEQEEKDPFSQINNILDLISFNNLFFELILREIALENWSDIEVLYFEQLNSLDDDIEAIKKYKSIKELNKDFNEIKKSLEIYLSLEENIGKPEVLSPFKFLFNQINSESTTILNFNYTNTLSIYGLGKSHLKTINIHGELNNSKNSIIFGYAANDEESRKLSKKNNYEYMRNIKKHNYKKTSNISKLNDYLERTKRIDVSILGHSCGLSDKLILEQIFNHENIKTIRIFYYKNSLASESF